MKLVNIKFFAITIPNNEQIGEILQTNAFGELDLEDFLQKNIV